jgi:hypothetical protein
MKKTINIHPLLRAALFGAIATGTTHAELVGQWVANDYTDEAPTWTSRVNDITATVASESAPLLFEEEFNGNQAIDFFPPQYFTVVAAENPVANATEMTLVAVFDPFAGGPTGAPNFYQANGLLGMEEPNQVNDWGLGWGDSRVVAGIGGEGDQDRTSRSNVRDEERLQVAILTWDGATGTQTLFVNGVQMDQVTDASTNPRNPNSFALGAMTAGGGNPFNGQVTELRLYDSDESANARTIALDLLDTYSGQPVLLEAELNSRTTGTITVADSSSQIVDEDGTFALNLNGEVVPSTNLQVSKTDEVTTVNFTADFVASTTYDFNLTTPLQGGGGSSVTGFFESYILAEEIPGLDGSVGTWGIREIITGEETGITAPPNIVSALESATGSLDPSSFIEVSAPVFNHFDPDTNGPATSGNFNNDFPLLSNTGEDDDFVVVGKTQVQVPAAGTYTFSVHGDDGFAMRVEGASGGRFTSASGLGGIDPADNTTLISGGLGDTGDYNTQGVYQFDDAGTYDILFLGYDGGIGGFYEVAWTEGAFDRDYRTNTWALVGSPEDTSIPDFRERYVAELPGPDGQTGTFGTRTYLDATLADETLVGTIGLADQFLIETDRTANGTETVDAQLPFLNHYDPDSTDPPAFFPNPQPFPANTGEAEDNVVTTAKGRIDIAEAGTYTFNVNSDDGFLLRLIGTGELANPVWTSANSGGNGGGIGRFEMSNLNELFFSGVGIANTRATIDLEAGSYDFEFVQVENGGGFFYAVGVANGEFLNADPVGGFALLQPGMVAPTPGGIMISNLTVSGTPTNSVSFGFTSEAGTSYVLQGSTDLTAGSFSELQTIEGTSGTTNVSFNPQDFPALDGDEDFFRVSEAE